MYCKYCNEELNENSKFCPKCGNSVEVPVQTYEAQAQVSPQTSNYSFAQNMREEERDSFGRNILLFSILGLVLSQFGIPGIILSKMARNKLGMYIGMYGETRGTASVGKILSLVGLILSIVSTVFLGLYGIIMVLVAMASSGGGYYYY